MLTKEERALMDPELATAIKGVLDKYTSDEVEPPEPPQPGDWTFLAKEGAYAQIPAGAKLRYGAQGFPYCIKTFPTGGQHVISNELFECDPAKGTAKRADRWTGAGTPPADTGPVNGGDTGDGGDGGNGPIPPKYNPYPLSWFPQAPGPAPLTDPQHAANFDWLWHNDHSVYEGGADPHRLAAYYNDEFYQRHQLSICNQYFGGNQTSLANWRNQYHAGETYLGGDEPYGLAQMQGVATTSKGASK